MAFNAGTILAKLKLDSKSFRAGMQKAAVKTDSFAKKALSLGTLMKGAVAAGFAVATFKMADMGGRLIDLDRAFQRLSLRTGTSGPEIIKQVRGITKALTDKQIKESANMLDLLGVGMEHTARMVEIAKAAAIGLNKPLAYMLESLSTGTARQSRLWLDNLGIIISVEEANKDYAEQLGKTVDAMTDMEKRAAFLNAVLEKGDDIIAKVGSDAESAAEKTQSLSASTANLKDNMTILANLSLGDMFESIADGVGSLADAMKVLNANLGDPQDLIDWGAAGMTLRDFIILKGGGRPSGGTGGGGMGAGYISDTEYLYRGWQRNASLPTPRSRGGFVGPQPGGQHYRESLYQKGRGDYGPEGRDLEAGPLPYALEPMKDVNKQAEIGINLFGSFGGAIEATFQTLMTNSERAGRVFAATMLTSIGNVASGMGDFALQSGLMMLGLQSLNPFMSIAAGIALKAIGGMLKGIGQKQVPPIVTPHRLSPQGQREEDVIGRGSVTLVVQGDFIGDKWWVKHLMEQMRRMSRDDNLTTVFAG